MTITLYLQKETLLRDITTIQSVINAPIGYVEKLRSYHEPLNISTNGLDKTMTAIQVTPEEFALIGIFNKGI